MLLLLLFPPMALLLLYRVPQRFTVFKSEGDPRTELAWSIIGSIIALLLSYRFGIAATTHLQNPLQLSWFYLGAFACYVAVPTPFILKSPARRSTFLWLSIFAVLYSIATINFTNTALDRSAPVEFHVEVIHKHQYMGYRSSPCYYLELEPWGPVATSTKVKVSVHLFDQVNAGDQVCLDLHPGLLHAAWYRLNLCSDQQYQQADP